MEVGEIRLVKCGWAVDPGPLRYDEIDARSPRGGDRRRRPQRSARRLERRKDRVIGAMTTRFGRLRAFLVRYPWIK
jgi:hypothetical protein